MFDFASNGYTNINPLPTDDTFCESLLDKTFDKLKENICKSTEEAGVLISHLCNYAVDATVAPAEEAALAGWVPICNLALQKFKDLSGFDPVLYIDTADSKVQEMVSKVSNVTCGMQALKFY